MLHGSSRFALCMNADNYSSTAEEDGVLAAEAGAIAAGVDGTEAATAYLGRRLQGDMTCICVLLLTLIN